MTRVRDRNLEAQRRKERLAAMSPEERECWLAARREKDRARRAQWKSITHDVISMRRTGPPAPPDYVLEEAARAARAQRSLTAQIMGDPVPGRRALDAKAGEVGLNAVAAALALEGL